MWCKTCNKIVYDKVCPTCGNVTQEDIPTEVYWCEYCKANGWELYIRFDYNCNGG